MGKALCWAVKSGSTISTLVSTNGCTNQETHLPESRGHLVNFCC